LDIIGIILIILGISIYITDFLDPYVIKFTWVLLSGSSEGKSILLFVGMGVILLLNSILISRKGFLSNLYTKIYGFSPEGRKYLIILAGVAFLTYFVGIAIEIFLRYKYGVSPLTIFVSLNPNPTSSSPMHSHVFKSVFGYLINISGFHVPGHINTGGSLVREVLPGAFLILFTLPLAFIAGILSLDKRHDLVKLLLALSVTLVLVSMVDGGLVSQPGVFGLAGIFVFYYVKSPFKLRQLLKPTFLIMLIVVSGMMIENSGSNSSYHDITVINVKQPIDWSGYPIMSIHEEGNKTVVRIKTDRGDKILLENLFNTLGGNADGFFMTWNFASYL
jgi:hypothetical protein